MLPHDFHSILYFRVTCAPFPFLGAGSVDSKCLAALFPGGGGVLAAARLLHLRLEAEGAVSPLGPCPASTFLLRAR